MRGPSVTDRPQVAGQTSEAVRTPENPVPAETLEEPSSEPQIKVRSTNGVERISVRAIGRRVRIIGEPSVATVSADGPHVLRRNGSVLEISSDGELGPSIDGFQILRGAPRTLEDFRSLGLGKELFLRVNPAIPIDIEVTAGSLHTERVPRLGNVRVTAGGAKMQDVTQVSDALIQAGQATITGTITQGRSTDPGRIGLGDHSAQRRLRRHRHLRGAAGQGDLGWTPQRRGR